MCGRTNFGLYSCADSSSVWGAFRLQTFELHGQGLTFQSSAFEFGGCGSFSSPFGDCKIKLENGGFDR